MGCNLLAGCFFAFDKSLQCCLVALAFRLQFANQLLACILLGFELGFGVQVFFHFIVRALAARLAIVQPDDVLPEGSLHHWADVAGGF